MKELEETITQQVKDLRLAPHKVLQDALSKAKEDLESAEIILARATRAQQRAQSHIIKVEEDQKTRAERDGVGGAVGGKEETSGAAEECGAALTLAREAEAAAIREVDSSNRAMREVV